MRHLSTKIRTSLLEKGACLVGYADVSDVVFEAAASLKNAVSIAVALNPSAICDISKGPTKRYHKEYNRANNLLTDLCGHTVDILISQGYNQLFVVFALMFAPGQKNIFRVNRKIEKSGMSKIFPAQTEEVFETAKKLFVEYAGAVFMELKLV